jgi:hypothetical protein
MDDKQQKQVAASYMLQATGCLVLMNGVVAEI